MHGLINRSIQCFVQDTYGAQAWQQVAEAAEVSPDGFEAMLRYDDVVTTNMLECLSERLSKPLDVLLEDLGTYLVANPRLEATRRLLRFGGEDFLEFLHSLEDLPGRARLAVPDLELPELEVREDGASCFRLVCNWRFPGACNLMSGILRAMADDYGALVVLDVEYGYRPYVRIELLDGAYAEGRQFDLARKTGAANA
ncbi:heme NO-binding domain-containing protein [Actibacterium sp. XHP0104]|uniref:heme NO-binding domain-containing protein n=1 Tax=Actibacterium sp. XHP0104 TaxID=2984335 RepID=UPI0021E8FEFF|nr:heme NO-binding domain-containing protein [Actibacterium sp. XHP0104]MCV2881400.1 heme NO-binding domain-containing protein [Actibacterium sp. XHP0104]